MPGLAAGEQATVRVEMEGAVLNRGSTSWPAGSRGPAFEHDLDRGPEPLRLRISGEDRGAGMVQLAHRVRVERNGRPAQMSARAERSKPVRRPPRAAPGSRALPDRRRPAPLLEPALGDGGDRLQAHLPWHRPRLRLVARAATL